MSPSPITLDDSSLFPYREIYHRGSAPLPMRPSFYQSGDLVVSPATVLDPEGDHYHSQSLLSLPPLPSSSFSHPGPVASQTMPGANSRHRHAAQSSYEECGETFPGFFSLRRHQQLHSGERPYKCRIPGCEAHFPNNKDRKRHENMRHKDLPISSVLPLRKASRGSRKFIESSLFHTNPNRCRRSIMPGPARPP
ncbi:hypothetical protein BDN67DRAFT_968822 [Paxillus ammoniavirescens]|nr:hypothetical protein BDN67DRAFT_968822 [Paxillus ammoniavirescens]